MYPPATDRTPMPAVPDVEPSALPDRTVGDAHHRVLAEHLDPEAVVGVTVIASHVLAIAHVVDALDVDPEGPFVG